MMFLLFQIHSEHFMLGRRARAAPGIPPIRLERARSVDMAGALCQDRVAGFGESGLYRDWPKVLNCTRQICLIGADSEK
jgi:hypothetical protein